MSDFIGKLGQGLEEENDEELSTSQTQLCESHLASFQANEIIRLRVSERLGNPGRLEQLSLQLGCSERLTQAHFEVIQRIRASKRLVYP